MEREEFERIAQEEFDALPDTFRTSIENVHVVIEEVDSSLTRKRAGVYAGGFLLGLYEGIPLTRRGTDYGMFPVVPDRITLFKRNIESIAATKEEVRARIREVLIHEVAHYFGMTEKEIRKAGY
jgi:predicted Zn-dependent protease with MMP-like domain